MERETTENLLKDAIAKNDDLESLTRQLYGILRYLQASLFCCDGSQILVQPRARALERRFTASSLLA
jgi:hypothetical protein